MYKNKYKIVVLLLHLIIVTCVPQNAYPFDKLSSTKTFSEYKYAGTIGKKKIGMRLNIWADGVITGWYHYEKYGEGIIIEGRMIDEKKCELSEFLSKYVGKDEEGTFVKGANTGLFRGEFKEAFSFLSGEWSSPDSAAKYPFRLTMSATKKTRSMDFSFLDKLDLPTNKKRELYFQMTDILSHEEESSFDIKYLSHNFVSMLFTIKYKGATHSNTAYETRTFWINAGDYRSITLSDFFVADSEYIKYLSDFCISELKKKGAGYIVDDWKTKLTEQEMSSYTISQKGITFYFAPYEVGAYAEGSYTVTIQYSKLRNILNITSPLAEFIKK